MSYPMSDPAERERRRWTRENAHLYIRPDAHRFMRPDAPGWVHPDHKLWNLYFRYPGRQRDEAGAAPVMAERRAESEFRFNQISIRSRPTVGEASGPSFSELLKLKSDLAALRVQLAVIRHEIATRKARGLPPLTEADEGWQIILKGLARFWADCRKAGFGDADCKAGFKPAQPRVPAGSPDGGQWTSVGGAIGEGGSQWVRLAASDKPSLGRGTIAAVLAQAAKQAIDAYRKSNHLWDLFGGKIGTVAVTGIDDTDLFGSNSTSPTYTNADRAAAVRLREKLLEKYPDIMNVEEIGQKPNDALFHAETTVLTRAARANGGQLAGRTLEIHVDRELCSSCRQVLPYIGIELGNPTVTFVGPRGTRYTMTNGGWINREQNR